MASQTEHMPGNRHSGRGGGTSRVERLLRERELRKFNRTFQLNDELGDGGFSDFGSASGEWVRAGEGEFLEAVAAAAALAAAGDGPAEQDATGQHKQRLLVVANRLPVSAVRRAEDSWSLDISAGGLVSVKEFETRWIGWAGVNVPDETGQRALAKALAEKRCIPVFLDEEIVHQYYNGYCNNVLWPLFHYLGLPQEDRLATTRSFQSQFDAYKRANQMFADVVSQHYEEGDVVWCHDYHLMFSQNLQDAPSRSELLRSVLAADVVGFHTYDYARHFVSACTRILGFEGTPEGVEDQGKLTRVAAFPIGIDSDRFTRALELPQVQNHVRDLRERFAGRKVMLGVDRLDMIKGIPQKILAFEKFLEEILLGLTSQVHEIVGRINGRFGTLTAVPIHHLDRSLDFHALCALYAVTDVALITSLRDGMNLVSYEFVACQEQKKGVLILSEFAGAAQSLGAGALLVNPWNITEVANSIGYALNMHNFAHVTTHTAQIWAETFVSELNDTVVEAQLRTRQVPPSLPTGRAIERFLQSKNRLLILGFNSTLTEQVEFPGRRGGDQIREMEPKLHPDLKEPLTTLCNDPRTTVVVLSGSDRSVLDDNFGDYNMWLAAENGMFLRLTTGEWMTTMPEHLNMDWVDSVKHVFEYFTERTPRSHFEHRETSLLWNYKYADVEFGRLQARDMLQHLWTGPISNAAVDVVQGGRSVEVRSVGVTKGAAIDRILGEIVHGKSMVTPIDYVLCLGHFLGKDEDIYTFFEPELPVEPLCGRLKAAEMMIKSSASSGGRLQSLPPRGAQRSGAAAAAQLLQEGIACHEGSSVLDLNGENYFSCAVGRKCSSARYSLDSADDVIQFLKQLARRRQVGSS
ncbi:unnamed protein product [Spirodela intermedia]|uniref:Uncharacterized protein n=1 Tax=Spirodela intermedia TaxID=51605 RepID=A0A7I8JU69_SPIIN|nr:unnamed protein product [Spirodela intermedia]CAA6673002.1 unnamed protein product [Spirodela intermedia]